MDREELRSQLEELFARMASDLARQVAATELLKRCEATLEEARKHLLTAIHSGKLSPATLPEVRAELQQFVKHFTTLAQLAPLQIEWLAFAEQLATRQGTHLPNWEEFYADREALERRIREQQGS